MLVCLINMHVIYKGQLCKCIAFSFIKEETLLHPKSGILGYRRCLPQLELSSAEIMRSCVVRRLSVCLSVCLSVGLLAQLHVSSWKELRGWFLVSRDLGWPLPMTPKTRSLRPSFWILWAKVHILHVFLWGKFWGGFQRLLYLGSNK